MKNYVIDVLYDNGKEEIIHIDNAEERVMDEIKKTIYDSFLNGHDAVLNIPTENYHTLLSVGKTSRINIIEVF